MFRRNKNAVAPSVVVGGPSSPRWIHWGNHWPGQHKKKTYLIISVLVMIVVGSLVYQHSRPTAKGREPAPEGIHYTSYGATLDKVPDKWKEYSAVHKTIGGTLTGIDASGKKITVQSAAGTMALSYNDASKFFEQKNGEALTPTNMQTGGVINVTYDANNNTAEVAYYVAP